MSNDDNPGEEKARAEIHDASDKLRALRGTGPKSRPEPEPPYCSFCGRGKNEYRHIIEGPSVYICDLCVSGCQDILSGKSPDEPTST